MIAGALLAAFTLLLGSGGFDAVVGDSREANKVGVTGGVGGGGILNSSSKQNRTKAGGPPGCMKMSR